MNALILAAGTALLSMMTASSPGVAADPVVIGDVEWAVTPPADGAPHLRIGHESSSSEFPLGEGAGFASARAALDGNKGPVSFSLSREAGKLDCSGTLTGAFAGGGRCRFTSDSGFEAALAQRGLTPEDREDLLAMMLVDVKIELADGLIGEGLTLKSDEDLIAAAALDVTAAYVHDLKSEALRLTDVEDVIACKALGVDGVYVRGLAAAGYRNLSAEDVVAMKAMDVSPDYAQAMNRARGNGQ